MCIHTDNFYVSSDGTLVCYVRSGFESEGICIEPSSLSLACCSMVQLQYG